MDEEMHNEIEIKIQNVDCITCHSDGNQFSTKTMEQYTEAPLYKVLRPIFTGMKLLGLYHHKQYIVTDEHRFEGIKNHHPPVYKSITPSRIYTFLVMFILWANVARMFTVFNSDEGFNYVLFQKILGLSFFCHAAMNATSFYRACHKFKNIPEVFYEWTRLHQEYPGE